MTIKPLTEPKRYCSWRRSTIKAAMIVTLFIATAPHSKADVSQSSALWRVVHDLCVVDKRTTGLPAPCTAVDLPGGIAIVKDAGGPTGYLAVPTRRLTGIEDPAILAPGAPNYWQAAWDARRFVERKARHKLHRADVAIAVNAVAGRTQDQLHFHVDCVRPEVKKELGSATFGDRWTYLSLFGHPYWVRPLKGTDLGPQDPFRLLAESDPAIASAMGRQTLIVIGALLDEKPGFYVLRGTVSPGYRGHGEELLDHQCRLLTR